MSRYSPDSWIDAVQLPLAMARFQFNLYTERMAPDIRPALCIALALMLAVLMALRRFGLRKCTGSSGPPDGAPPNLRALYATLVCAALVFALWIATSANGRYGVVALILTAPAILALLLLVTHSHGARLGVLLAAVGLQCLFVDTSNPGYSWNALPGPRWTGSYVDRYPDAMIHEWKDETRNHRVLVVTTKPQTAMSLLYNIFGPKAHYMALAYINWNELPSSPEVQRAIEEIQWADVIYWSDEFSSDKESEDKVLDVKLSPSVTSHFILERFGILAADNLNCHLFPIKMNARVRVCRLQNEKTTPKNGTKPPSSAYKLLLRLSKKCPSVFGDHRVKDPSQEEISVLLNDMKYAALITPGLDVYLRHITKVNYTKILSGNQTENLNHMTCDDLLKYGHQYW